MGSIWSKLPEGIARKAELLLDQLSDPRVGAHAPVDHIKDIMLDFPDFHDGRKIKFFGFFQRKGRAPGAELSIRREKPFVVGRECVFLGDGDLLDCCGKRTELLDSESFDLDHLPFLAESEDGRPAGDGGDIRFGEVAKFVRDNCQT